MIKASFNQKINLNINLSDNITIPIVKLGNELEIPTLPFVWHREESINIPIQALIKIPNETMNNILDSKVSAGIMDPDIKKIISNELQESYIVSQYTVLEKVTYYISYHGFAYREQISKEPCVTIPQAYNKTVKFQSIIYPLSLAKNIYSPFTNSPLRKIATGDVFIHGQAFSPPGCFHFKIEENCEDYVFVVHGKNSTNNKTSTVLFIMVNDHNTKDIDKIMINEQDPVDSLVKNLVDNIIDNAFKKATKKSTCDQFIDILTRDFSENLCKEIDIIKKIKDENAENI